MVWEVQTGFYVFCYSIIYKTREHINGVFVQVKRINSIIEMYILQTLHLVFYLQAIQSEGIFQIFYTQEAKTW